MNSAQESSNDPTRINLALDPLTRRMSGVARHGNTPFDVPFISKIEGNFYQGGCTTGLELPKHIEHVVSLYPWEQYTVRHDLKSMGFHWLYDDTNEPPPVVHAIARWVASCVEDGPTLLHCQAGLNRSSLIAALVLMRQGRTAEESIALLREKRSPAVLCNKTFEAWLTALNVGPKTQNADLKAG